MSSKRHYYLHVKAIWQHATGYHSRFRCNIYLIGTNISPDLERRLSLQSKIKHENENENGKQVVEG